MKALLLVAHGSRRKQSNDEVVVLADKLKKIVLNNTASFMPDFWNWQRH